MLALAFLFCGGADRKGGMATRRVSSGLCGIALSNGAGEKEVQAFVAEEQVRIGGLAGGGQKPA
jgi:hypothetical protein